MLKQRHNYCSVWQWKECDGSNAIKVMLGILTLLMVITVMVIVKKEESSRPIDDNAASIFPQRPDGDRWARHQPIRWSAAACGPGSCHLQRRPHGDPGEFIMCVVSFIIEQTLECYFILFPEFLCSYIFLFLRFLCPGLLSSGFVSPPHPRIVIFVIFSK